LNERFHHVRVCRGNQNFSLRKVSRRLTGDNLSFEGIDDVCIGGLCPGKHLTFVYVHVGLSDISHGNQPFQHALFVDHGNRIQILLLHHVPGPLYGQVSAHARGLSDFNVLHLGGYIVDEKGNRDAEPLQDVPGFLIDSSRSGRNIAASVNPILQSGVADRRADRIRIRIAVPDNIYFFFIRHGNPRFHFVL